MRLLKRTMPLLLTAYTLAGLLGASPAFAQSPWWHLSFGSRPSSLPAASENEEGTVVPGKGQIVLTASNLGDASTSGVVSVTDTLPAGVKAVSVSALAEGDGFAGPVTCPTAKQLHEGAPVSCTFSSSLPPYDDIEVRIGVEVLPGAVTGERDEATVSGGGASSSVSITPAITVGGEPAFGVEDYELGLEEEGGAPDTQAGSHPFQQTTTLTLDQGANTAKPEPVALPRDVSVRWPPGLIGNPTTIPRCSLAQFGTVLPDGQEAANACPPQSAVGVVTALIDEPVLVGVLREVVPLFNLEPAAGEPARFGFYVPAGNAPVLIDTAVRSGEDYGVTVSSHNISQNVGFLSSQITVWGVPGEASHDNARGWGCLAAARGREHVLPCTPLEEQHPSAFLALPTACSGPSQSTVESDSWAAPGSFTAPLAASLPALDGCNRLPFHPSIKVTPDGTAASSPTGLTVDVHVPQEESLNASGLAEAAPRNITVSLPEGVAVNPADGDGLQACSEGLVGFTGFAQLEGASTATFTGKLPEPLEPGVNFCPNAAKVGTATIKTPFLPNALEGAVYVATQNENPFGSLLAMYLVAQDPVSGVLAKLVGQVHLTETGQLVATFENSPQAPFEDAEVHFFGGERAPLATPAHCGPYKTTALFTPWSSNEAAPASSTFEINSGPHESPCPGASLPFSPSLTGGTTNIDAGAFTTLTTTISREDGNQDMQSVQLHMPAGVEGLLSSIKLCPEQQANEGTCGPESRIGETTVSAGVGSQPVSVKGGRIYLTEKYQGAPFGLSIVNPVKAGPFDLEHDTSNPNQQPPCDCLVVRAKIEVNPQTGELTVTTDPSGAHAIPHLIDGIPVQIKKVNATINREHFTFNPTNCNPLSITSTITSDEGISALASTPFQVTNCAILKFSPQLTVSTAGKASKANGASLLFKIAFPKNGMGTQSWLSEAKFYIPKQLPARLNTLQKACLAAVFEHNRAACPPASIIGHAIVHTQVLPVPLEGPLYFVSYGGAKFPDAVLVLHGYGVTIEQHGETFINNKTGVTSATFRSIPNVPFETLEVTVPQGPTSEFGVNLPTKDKYSLCGQKLTMPTEFTAANGLQIHQNTPISITGCAKTTRAQKLAAALKACHKRKGKTRIACEATAHRKFGSAKHAAKRK